MGEFHRTVGQALGQQQRIVQATPHVLGDMERGRRVLGMGGQQRRPILDGSGAMRGTGSTATGSRCPQDVGAVGV